MAEPTTTTIHPNPKTPPEPPRLAEAPDPNWNWARAGATGAPLIEIQDCAQSLRRKGRLLSIVTAYMMSLEEPTLLDKDAIWWLANEADKDAAELWRLLWPDTSHTDRHSVEGELFDEEGGAR